MVFCECFFFYFLFAFVSDVFVEYNSGIFSWDLTNPDKVRHLPADSVELWGKPEIPKTQESSCLESASECVGTVITTSPCRWGVIWYFVLDLTALGSMGGAKCEGIELRKKNSS